MNKIFIDISNCDIVHQLNNKVSIGTVKDYKTIYERWDEDVFIVSKDINNNLYKGYGIYVLLISIVSNKNINKIFFADDNLVKLWNILWQSETIAYEIRDKVSNIDLKGKPNYKKLKIINSMISDLVLHNNIAIIILGYIDYILHS